MAGRVVFVGLDAYAPRIARSLIRQGRLSNLAALRTSGRTVPVRTPLGLVVGAVWPSVWSGRWPDSHGFISWLQHVPGTYVMRKHDPTDIHVPPVWDLLAKQGVRSVVVDVPLCPPSRVDGVRHVVDWGTHDRMLEPTAWPAAEATLLRDHPHPTTQSCDDFAVAGSYDELFTTLHGGIDHKVRFVQDLLSRDDDWQLGMVVFGESHCAGHHFWRLHAETPDDSPLEAVYVALDRALGELLPTIADEGDTVAVLLSHGIGDHYDGDWLLHDLLARVDVELGGASRLRARGEQARRVTARLGRRTAALLGRPRPYTRPIDASRRWFRVPNNDLYGAIRLNLVGRDPRGRVRPGADADHAGHVLEQALLDLRNAETGEPVVRRVLRTSDHFSGGPRSDALPDLLVDWNRRSPIRRVTHPTLGEFSGGDEPLRTGDHREGGLLVVTGPGIGAGYGPAIDAVDIAPTLADRIGVRLDGLDGTPMPVSPLASA